MEESPRSESSLGPALGTALFVAVVPGTVAGWVPWWLSGWEVGPPLLGLAATRWLGAAVFAAAVPFFVDFAVRFALQGKGTPAPVAPPTHFVASGTFRWTRNPGYVGVVGMIAGQGLWFGSTAVLVYAACVALAFHAFVVLYEEPDLRRRFPDTYDDYCRRVPRWLF